MTIHFVHKSLDSWPDIDAIYNKESIAALRAKIENGRDAWIINTYLILKLHGYDVSISSDFLPDEICVAHYDDVPVSKYPWRSFVVSIRADRERTFLCDCEIVQSPTAIEADTCYYVQHWSQPNLIRRDAARGDNLTRLAYFGTERNLAAKFRSQEFLDSLSSIGVEFVIFDDPSDWHDYSSVDMILAVRDGTKNFLSSKPATKLFNAWLAGCPAIVGDEPAYAYYKNSRYDYIHAGNAHEVVKVIKQLKNSPDEYARFRNQASLRASEVNDAATLANWVGVLYGPVKKEYISWLRKKIIYRRLDSAARFYYRYLRRRIRGRSYVRGYDFEGNMVFNMSYKRRVFAYLDKYVSILDRKPPL